MCPRSSLPSTFKYPSIVTTLMKNINVYMLTTIRKKSFTRLETTLMMKTIVNNTIGIDHCQDGNLVRMETPVRMEISIR